VSVVHATVVIWVCDFCGRSANEASTDGTPAAEIEAQSFVGWTCFGKPEVRTVACDRCKDGGLAHARRIELAKTASL
jgi:hypothetical protein